MQTAARAPGGEFGRAAEEEARAEDARLARGRAEGHEPAEGQPPVDRGGPAIYAETFERGLLTAPSQKYENRGPGVIDKISAPISLLFQSCFFECV